MSAGSFYSYNNPSPINVDRNVYLKDTHQMYLYIEFPYGNFYNTRYIEDVKCKKMVKCIGIYKKSWYQHSLTFWLVIICSILTLCTSKLSYNHRAENKGGLKVA